MHARALAQSLPTLLCLGALAAQTEAPKKYLLRHAFEEGKTTWSVGTLHANTKNDFGGIKQEWTLDTQTFTSQTIGETRSGKARILQSIDRLKVVAKMPGGDVDYDSDVEGSDPGRFAQATGLIGKRLEMWMDARGNASDVKVPDGMDDAMKIAVSIDSAQLADQRWLMLPDEPVAIGTTWETEMGMPWGRMNNAKVKVKSKLVEVTGRKARIEQVMQMGTERSDVPGVGKIEKMSGTLIIDLASWQVPEEKIEVVTFHKGPNIRTEITITTKATDPPKNAKPTKQPEAREPPK